MGCVLAKGASGKRGDRRKKHGGDERRDSGTAAGTAANSGAERKTAEVPVPAATSTAAAATVIVPEFRLRRGLSTGGEEWPSWLNDVAGHAIKNWKPRRASTFEKIDKVTAVVSLKFTFGRLGRYNDVMLAVPRYNHLMQHTHTNLYRMIMLKGPFCVYVPFVIVCYYLPSLSVQDLDKILQIGQGTYSNVYKAKDLITGKVVALKKVRFDNLEPETVRFMAREILVLRKLDHPNVIKLEGVAISRMSSSLYLIFEYMEHDLAGLTAFQSVKFTEPQVSFFVEKKNPVSSCSYSEYMYHFGLCILIWLAIWNDAC